MTRKLLIRLIASACIAQGLWDLGEFLSPFFSLPAPITLKVFALVGGIWELYAGLYLFRLSETGRKLTIVLSFIGMAINAIIIFWFLFFWKEGYALTLSFRDQIIFESENRFISAGVDFVFFTILLLIILFLSQDKTKKLFTREAVSNVDAKTFVESA